MNSNNALPKNGETEPVPGPARPRSNEAQLLEVELALTALRRGVPVALRTGGVIGRLLILPLEGLTRPAVARLERLAGGPLRLALTAERLHHLGLTEAADGEARIVGGAEGSTIDLALVLADPLGEGRVGLEDTRVVETGWPSAAIDAAVTLPRLAGLMPASLIAAAAPGRDSDAIGHRCEAEAEVILAYERATAADLHIVADARVPLGDAETVRLIAFRPSAGGPEHLALVIGQPDFTTPVLVRLHSSCLTGDVLGSLRCDCGQQLRGAIRTMAAGAGGVLLYLAQEGRGIGLVNKLRAYELQDRGFDTVDANERLGFAADERIYGAAAAMLRALSLPRIQLMTNNPEKVRALEHCGIDVVRRVPHAFPPNHHNRFYLETKARRSGHLLRGLALGNGADTEHA